MNVKDIKDEDVPMPETAEEMLDIMLDRQSKLEDVYYLIERRGSKTFTINSRIGQVWTKDFLWRMMEEVGEFLDAKYVEDDYEHYREELADSFHFVLGLTIILGKHEIMKKAVKEYFSQNMSSSQPEPFENCVAYLVRSSGMLANTLKMKPWKQTDVLTDEAKFDEWMACTIISFLHLCNQVHVSFEDLYVLYWKKSEVNLFRQRSKY